MNIVCVLQNVQSSQETVTVFQLTTSPAQQPVCVRPDSSSWRDKRYVAIRYLLRAVQGTKYRGQKIRGSRLIHLVSRVTHRVSLPPVNAFDTSSINRVVLRRRGARTLQMRGIWMQLCADGLGYTSGGRSLPTTAQCEGDGSEPIPKVSKIIVAYRHGVSFQGVERKMNQCQVSLTGCL